ncbi:hypothetical protein XH83_27750 [Bradyrhizobium sp. CCBAU 53351]|uniref:hypothetical protein n=1 Tax=Bradyrhizobium sp. CCBAU 53351 TaxID=1325114 RepID=UPI001886D438|nr:hypothetical protein [Bradyrhizobium sp. CCBAU 53351]QOZ78864.1 hypothetical protein XH83_27750 [Bradyrhizobium sp. CCBAU 53351]
MPSDRRLFDSSSMTPPPAPEIDAVTCNLEPVAGDVHITDDVIFVTMGVDVARGYDPNMHPPAPAWPPRIPLYQREVLASLSMGKKVRFI